MSGQHYAAIARSVLTSALDELIRGSVAAADQPSGIVSGRLWIAALHNGFRAQYQDASRVEILSYSRPQSGLVDGWLKQEFLFDLVVATVEHRSGPYQTGARVPIVTGCIWLVESEMALDGSAVAKDVAKLVAGSASAKLFIAAKPSPGKELKRWLDFISDAIAYAQGHLFVALIPSYSTLKSSHHEWRQRTAAIELYEIVDRQLVAVGAPIVFEEDPQDDPGLPIADGAPLDVPKQPRDP